MTDLFRLPESMAAWGREDFSTTLKREIISLGVLRLMLARHTNRLGSIDDPITVMVLGADERGEIVEARVSVLFTVTGTAYCCPVGHVEDSICCSCEVTMLIDKSNAEATFLTIGDAG